MFRLKSFDLSFRTAYAQAKEIALAQTTIPLLTAGSLQEEQRAGGRFSYRYRYDVSGKRSAEYLGALSDERTAARVEQARQEIQDQQTLADYSRNLRKIGFYGAENSAVVTVATLFNAGIFGKGAILIGSHAFGAMLNEIGFTASPFPMTEDVDVARARRIEIAALPEGGLLAVLKQTGLPFHEVPGLKRGEPPTSFKVRGRRLKVDLLVPSDRAPYKAIPIPELRAYATGLPYLAYLLEETVTAVLIGRDRIVPVAVPDAGRFCIHKLALYSLRSSSEDAKREKDIFQAAVLAAALAAEQDFKLKDAIDAMNKALRSRIKPGAQRARMLLQSQYAEAVELLGQLC